MAGMRCLVLDDDKNRLKQFRQWLNEPGIVLVMVETAAEAIQKLQDEQFHAVFLDHDLGGECYVDESREDCGSEVTRRLKDGRLVQDHRCCFVLHSLNDEAAWNQIGHLKAAGYTNIFRMSYLEMRQQGGPNIRIN